MDRRANYPMNQKLKLFTKALCVEFQHSNGSGRAAFLLPKRLCKQSIDDGCPLASYEHTTTLLLTSSSMQCSVNGAAEFVNAVDRFPNLNRIRLIIDSQVESEIEAVWTNLVCRAKGARRVFDIAVSTDAICVDDTVGASLERGISGLARMIKAGGGSELICLITPTSCHQLEEIKICFKSFGIINVKFVPDELWFQPEGDGSSGDGFQNSRFHLMCFFDSLAQPSQSSYETRRLYRKTLESLATANPGLSRSLNFVPISEPLSPTTTSPADENESLGALKTDLCRLTARQFDLIDYYPPLGEVIGVGLSTLRNRMVAPFGIKEKNPDRYTAAVRHPKDNRPENWKRILITGWYGTETQGDKAILGEVVHFLREQSPDCEFTISSLIPYISRQTNLEIEGLSDATVRLLSECHDREFLETMDVVVIGGGPLMESSAMYDILDIFSQANGLNISRVIFGCGVGPLHSNAMRRVAARVIGLASLGFLRDKESWQLAGELCPEHRLAYACDPALAYVHRWRQNLRVNDFATPQHRRIGCLLRANTGEFSPGGDVEELNKIRERGMARALVQIGSIPEVEIDLLAMNTPSVGGDDRLFNRKVASHFPRGFGFCIEKRYRTLDEHLLQLTKTECTIAMRYHGHIFSAALGLPFASIDYTGKSGKVRSFVTRIGCDEFSHSWNDISGVEIAKSMSILLDSRDDRVANLRRNTERMIEDLNHTYESVFELNS